jgi:hypothetical protein
MRSRKKRLLTQQDLQAAGATPGFMFRRISPAIRPAAPLLAKLGEGVSPIE